MGALWLLDKIPMNQQNNSNILPEGRAIKIVSRLRFFFPFIIANPKYSGKHLKKSFPVYQLGKACVFIDFPFCLLPFYFCLSA
jgi:hypothetical protein